MHLGTYIYTWIYGNLVGSDNSNNKYFIALLILPLNNNKNNDLIGPINPSVNKGIKLNRSIPILSILKQVFPNLQKNIE